MPTSRLTVTLPENEIRFLKKYAKKNKTSISELINRWIEALKTETVPSIHPDIKKFTGIIPSDIDAKSLYSEHIMEKHQ